jgi:hypothetical protein
MINLESGRDRDNIEIQRTAERQKFQPKDFHASRGRQISYTFDKQSQVLAVAGCIVDEIVGVSREYPNLRDSQNPTAAGRRSQLDFELGIRSFSDGIGTHTAFDQRRLFKGPLDNPCGRGEISLWRHRWLSLPDLQSCYSHCSQRTSGERSRRIMGRHAVLMDQ